MSEGFLGDRALGDETLGDELPTSTGPVASVGHFDDPSPAAAAFDRPSPE